MLQRIVLKRISIQEQTEKLSGFITCQTISEESKSDTHTETNGHKLNKEDEDRAEYTIEKICNHNPQGDGTNKYILRNYYYVEDEDSLEPIGNFYGSKVEQYFRRKWLEQPEYLNGCRVSLPSFHHRTIFMKDVIREKYYEL